MDSWIRITLVPQPMTGEDGSLQVVRRTLVGQVRKPSRPPWWFMDALDQWSKHTSGRRELGWEDLPEATWADELYSRNRMIPVFKPIYPVRRPRLALVTPDIMEKLNTRMNEMVDQQLDFSKLIDPNFLRSLGVVFEEEIKGDAHMARLQEQGYQMVNVADGTAQSLMPWLPPKMGMNFEPATDPNGDRIINLGPHQVFSWGPWKSGQDWDEIVEQLYPDLIKTATQVPPLRMER